MNIKELKRNKKNRNLVLYLRKVVESYRAGFLSSKELKTDLHMDFKRVRHLNAECRPLGILNIELFPI